MLRSTLSSYQLPGFPCIMILRNGFSRLHVEESSGSSDANQNNNKNQKWRKSEKPKPKQLENQNKTLNPKVKKFRINPQPKISIKNQNLYFFWLASLPAPSSSSQLWKQYLIWAFTSQLQLSLILTTQFLSIVVFLFCFHFFTGSRLKIFFFHIWG